MSTEIPAGESKPKTSSPTRYYTVVIGNQAGYSGALDFVISTGEDAGSHSVNYPTNQFPSQKITFYFTDPITTFYHNAPSNYPPINLDLAPA